MASPELTCWAAVQGVLVPVPGQPAKHGMSASYVGRALDQGALDAGETDLEKLYPPSADANCKFLRSENVGVVSELYRIAKHGDIAPADEVTSKWCGIPMNAAPTAAPVVEAQPQTQPQRTRRSAPTEGSQ